MGQMDPGGCTARPGGGSSEPAGITACDGAVAGQSPLIDDFDDGDMLSVPVDARGAMWFTYTDETPGCLEARVAVADGNPALRITGNGFTRWGAGFGTSLSWSLEAQKACMYDASTYQGLRFRARGNAKLRVALQTHATTFRSRGGGCPDSELCFDQHGRTLHLSSTWQEYELEFCALGPEGWGGDKPAFDASTLIMLNVQVHSLEPFEVWLDDVSFVARSEDADRICGPICPHDELPLGIEPTPTQTSIDPVATGVKLFTFDQETPSCGALTRRYLAYVPSQAEGARDAPVLIVLPGSGADAESMRDFMTQQRFEELADRDGFIVVYANAVPAALATTPDRPNGGAFRQLPGGEVNDHDYLLQIIEDLRGRSLLSGSNAVFLAGLSNGGGMALEAARQAPNRYQGIAAVMPYVGEEPSLPEALATWSTTSVLIAYTHGDPGLPSPGYNQVIERLPAAWASALGISPSAIAAPVRTEIADLAIEGEGYTGAAPTALKTRNSRAIRIDYGPSATGAAVRVFEFDRAGHFWPVLQHNDPPSVLARWGLRNQDMDAAEAIWEFFK